jgi:hypothetical protein
MFVAGLDAWRLFAVKGFYVFVTTLSMVTLLQDFGLISSIICTVVDC